MGIQVPSDLPTFHQIKGYNKMGQNFNTWVHKRLRLMWNFSPVFAPIGTVGTGTYRTYNQIR